MQNKKIGIIIASFAVVLFVGVTVIYMQASNKANDKVNVVGSSSDDTIVAFNESGDAFNGGDLDESIAISERQLKNDPDNIVTLSAYGIALLEKGTAEFNEDEYGKKGLDVANQMIDINSTFVEGYFIKGYAYEIMGKYDDALKAYQQYSEIKKDSKILNQIGHIYDLQGNNDKAIESYEQAIEMDSSNSIVSVNIARAYIGKDDFEMAEKVLVDVIENGDLLSNRKVSEAYSLLGEVVLRKNNELKRSNELHNQALKFDPNNVSALVGSGWTNFLITMNSIPGVSEEEASSEVFVDGIVKNINESEKIIKRAIDIYPQKSAAYYYLGAMYELTDRGEESQSMYSKSADVVDSDITMMQDEKIEFKKEIESKLQKSISLLHDIRVFFIKDTHAAWWHWVISQQLKSGAIDASDFSGGYFHCANGAKFQYDLGGGTKKTTTPACSGSWGGCKGTCGTGTQTHSCGGTQNCTLDPCPINGQCNSSVNDKEYLFDTTGYDANQCTNGDPSNTNFPEPEQAETWTCSGQYGGAVSEECSASRLKPPSNCGDSNGLDEINVKATVENEACFAHNDVNISVTLNNNGNWDWTCAHDYFFPLNRADTEDVDCSAPTCLVENQLNMDEFVYFNSDGTVPNVTVGGISCTRPGTETGTTPVCCTIGSQAITIGGVQRNSICTGETGEIEINPGDNNFDVRCWFDEDNDGEDDGDDNDEDGVTNTVNVGTMCTTKSCNAQGTCQSTPVTANNISICSTECSSDADCSSGSMIETQP